MRRRPAKVGDLIGINASPGIVGVAKVIYVSRVFKDVIGLRLFDCFFDHLPSGTELPTNPSYLEKVIYTGCQSVGKEWPIIGYTESPAEDLQLTRRIVAGDVYVGDENLGGASADDRQVLRSMGVAGMYAVHDEVARNCRSGGDP